MVSSSLLSNAHHGTAGGGVGGGPTTLVNSSSYNNLLQPLLISSTTSTVSGRGPISLPLLEGLAYRKGAPQQIVLEALKQYRAGVRIAQWVMAQRRQRRRQMMTTSSMDLDHHLVGAAAAAAAGGTNNHSNHRKRRLRRGEAPAAANMSSSSHHWLIQGLLSPSHPERQVACRILVEGCPVDDWTMWQVLELLVVLLQQQQEPPEQQQQHNTKSKIGIIALLKHILRSVVKPPMRLAFLKQRFLDWICQAIWKQSSTCQKNHQNNNIMDDYSVALVDLLYHLVLLGNDEVTLQHAHAHLWKKEQFSLHNNNSNATPTTLKSMMEHPHALSSSLACLVGTHQIWKQSPHGSGSTSYDGLLSSSIISSSSSSPFGTSAAALSASSPGPPAWKASAYQLLQELMDPMATPKVEASSTSANTSSSSSSSTNKTAPQFLVDTFPNSHNNSNTKNNNDKDHNKSSSKSKPTAPSGSSSPPAAGGGSSSAPPPSRLLPGGGTTSNNSPLSSLLADSHRSEAASAAAAGTSGGGRAAGRGASSSATDRSAAATVARIFSAVYGGNEDDVVGGNLSDHHPSHHHHHHHDDEEEDEDDDDDLDEDHDDDDDEDDDHHHHHHHRHHSAHDNFAEDDDEENEDHDEHDQDDEDEDDHDNDEDEEHHEHHHHHEEELVVEGGSGSKKAKKDTDREMEEDEDEEIDSDEGDDDDDDDDDDEDCEGEEDEHEIVVHDEEDMARLEQGLMELNQLQVESSPVGLAAAAAAEGGDVATSSASTLRSVQERKQIYIQACMQVLATCHPLLMRQQSLATVNTSIPLPAERALMHSILHIVKPTKKPANTKLILRRAPTQEEFFRGNLSKNPISLDMLRRDNHDPTVKDLRQYIANDLQMADSAELLELLVANKILDVDLKLRVVHQVVWKDHLMQNSTSTAPAGLSNFLGSRGAGGGTRSFISAGPGLSMIFSTSGLDRSALGLSGRGGMGGAGGGLPADTPLTSLPPMIVTYRLTGVDGEATEDTVTTLQDPEAPSETASAEEVERLMEREFGITRLITEGRGVFCLLRSVERNINDTLRKIRRDDVGTKENPSRNQFKHSAPYPGLVLLQCCSKLPSNRKLLLQSRAPTILLRLLLDVLHALEDDASNKQSESNPTAKGLQELIEVLASDMLKSDGKATSSSMEEGAGAEEAEMEQQDASTLRLLLSAIETSSLSRPLRNVIAKLLPYLTYGQATLSKELALEFVRHVVFSRLGDCEKEEDHDEMVRNRSILLQTFVHASISLPANDVCNSLRDQLIHVGFVGRAAGFILQGAPQDPPSWSNSLWARGESVSKKQKTSLEKKWRECFQRPGLKIAFDMLIGLSKQHRPTQTFLGQYPNNNETTENPASVSLIRVCHWIEATSDNSTARISLNGLGLVAETLLDELVEEGGAVGEDAKAIRRKTRERKKEIAMDRRSKTLCNMSSFGPLAGSASLSTLLPSTSVASTNNNDGGNGPTVRSTAASLLGPVLGLFQNAESAASPSPPPSKRRRRESPSNKDKTPVKPAWMTEMEDMEDETGLTCAVCQEGRTLQPSELLGLYAYVKKVSVPIPQCGARSCIDGTSLLISLPTRLPSSMVGTHAGEEWYTAGKAAGDELRDSSRANIALSMANSRRGTYYTTTVSAGNPIHINCHAKARQADRSHPKAPKSEWEGASLRNSRVNCNVILPLVSSRSSKVPLVSVDVALTDHQTAVSNLLGARPKSMLWNILHDVRFLLLRMAYGEPLNADCGGGSLMSNSQLVFYQLLMADMFEKDAQIHAPETAQHARSLSAGYLAASAITKAEDYDKSNQSSLLRGLSDSAPMACLTCVLFHNNKNDYSSASNDDDETPNPKRRWVIGKEYFLRGLLNCAGRRHALGVDSSGCNTGRNGAARKRGRTAGFAEWEIIDDGDDIMEMELPSRSRSDVTSNKRGSKAGIDDFRDALRPMIVYYAIMDQLSNDFVLSIDDVKVEDCAGRLVQVIEGCHRAKNIHELLRKANVTMDHDDIIEELQKGMISA